MLFVSEALAINGMGEVVTQAINGSFRKFISGYVIGVVGFLQLDVVTYNFVRTCKVFDYLLYLFCVVSFWKVMQTNNNVCWDTCDYHKLFIHCLCYTRTWNTYHSFQLQFEIRQRTDTRKIVVLYLNNRFDWRFVKRMILIYQPLCTMPTFRHL